MNEFRKNFLKDAWVLVAPTRAKNYNFTFTKNTNTNLIDPFVPGNESLTDKPIFEYKQNGIWRTRVLANKFPMTNLESSQGTKEQFGTQKQGGFGIHEMIVDSRTKERHFFDFTQNEHEYLYMTIKNRMYSLYKDKRIKSIYAFKDEGFLAGGTIPHSNTQLVGFGFIYPELDSEINISTSYFQDKQRSIFSDMVANARKHSLVIEENRAFIAFVPFCARFEFEVWIFPLFKQSNFGLIDEASLKLLARIITQTNKKLKQALGNVDLSVSLFSAPTPFEHTKSDYFYKIDDHYRWHIEISPRVKPVSSMTVGSNIYINTVAPEESAKYLRKI